MICKLFGHLFEHGHARALRTGAWTVVAVNGVPAFHCQRCSLSWEGIPPHGHPPLGRRDAFLPYWEEDFKG
ncbi:hypothetical protein SEA_BOBBY_174 [Mycobacterium phage Bobby]|nr:hypothetical protein SEA_BOBBY_174 [Mycobacterium phage Bobby]